MNSYDWEGENKLSMNHLKRTKYNMEEHVYE